LAVVAALRFANSVVDTEFPGLSLPLSEALEILEKEIDPDENNYLALKFITQELRMAAPGKPVVRPSRPLSDDMIRKVAAAVAVDLQCRAGLNLKSALKVVAGDGPGAVERMRDFRENLQRRDTAQRSYYFELLDELKGEEPAEAADAALAHYRALSENP
jgi:hypothetical protein